MFALNLDTFVWKQIEPNGGLPSARVSFSGTQMTNEAKIFYFGGYNADGKYENKPIIFDIEKEEWSILENLNDPMPRFQNVGQRVGNQFVVLGGYNDQLAYPGYLEQLAIFEFD